MYRAAENHSRNPSWPASLPWWSERETRPRRPLHPAAPVRRDAATGGREIIRSATASASVVLPTLAGPTIVTRRWRDSRETSVAMGSLWPIIRVTASGRLCDPRRDDRDVFGQPLALRRVEHREALQERDRLGFLSGLAGALLLVIGY